MKLRHTTLVVTALFLLAACEDEAPVEQTTQVVWVPVIQQDVTIFGTYVGRTEASQRVEVNARIDGFLEEISFVEGSVVSESKPLYRIDPRPFQANVERLEAILASKQASKSKFERDVARIEPLFHEDAASQLDYDVALSSAEQGAAAVREAEANLKRAQLELDYTNISAPISGVIGASEVDVGALIRSNDSKPLTIVSQIDPIYVNYAMSALDYLNARRRVSSFWEDQLQEQQGKALEGKVSITLPDESVYQYEGAVGFTDPQVNPQTGTFAVRAIVPNPDKELLPGQYTRVKMPIEVRENALLIPEESTVIEQGGVHVMVVLPNNRVEQRLIFVGTIVDGNMIVENGLVEGERIIVHGINKVFHGALTDPITLEEHNAAIAATEAAQISTEPTATETPE